MGTIDDVMAKITAEVVKVLGKKPEEDVSLFDQGIDSVQLMGIAECAHDAFPDLEFADLAEEPTLVAWREVFEDFA